ncbi:MAG: hypothetical protein IPJ84_16825 [Bdellovibrionales bacterium]|nr:hypothetical protein [Bdellovibrionales bacterium]
MIRYFERVLGLKSIPNISIAMASVAEQAMPVADGVRAPMIGLVDLEDSARPPSIEEMALRLRDAVSGEWHKLKGGNVAVDWVRMEEANGVRLLIVFGAGVGFHHEGCPVVLAPSLKEMATSPALKRSGWLSIQSALRSFS